MSIAIQSIFYNNPDQYPPIVNGTRLLALAGHQVSLLCRDTGQDWQVDYPSGVHVERLKATSSSSWREYLCFVLHVLQTADRAAGVFIAHDMHGLLPAQLLAWRNRRPLIYHCHDFVDSPASLATGGRLVKAFEQNFAHKADLVIVPDKDRAKVMAHALHLNRPPLIVANAPLRKPLPVSQRLQRTLAARGICFERVVFRQGRIGVGHAVEATIRSLALWNHPAWGFVVMGHGESAYTDHLISVAHSLGVTEQFAVLPPVAYDQVSEFTVGADVGHALYEPIHINNIHITTASNKTLEYMAAGLPLLVSDRPALRQFVETYQCGITADEGSPESIAAAVNRLLGDEQQASRFGRAARLAFEQEFCYERQFVPVLDWLHALETKSAGRNSSH